MEPDKLIWGINYYILFIKTDHYFWINSLAVSGSSNEVFQRILHMETPKSHKLFLSQQKKIILFSEKITIHSIH